MKLTLQKECDRLLSERTITIQKLERSTFSDVFKNVSNSLDITYPRQIVWHVANNVQSIPLCKCGKKLPWHPDLHQYRIYCCKRCTQIYSVVKQVATSKANHGGVHHTQTQDYRDKVKATSQRLFGKDHYRQTSEFTKAYTATNLKNLGVEYPAQSPIVQAKMSDTYKEKTGYDYPTQNPEVQDLMKKTFKNRTGYDHPLQDPEINAKRKQTNTERYGSPHVLQNAEIAAKLSNTIKLNHYSDYAYEKIHDPEWLQEQNYSGRTVGDIAKELGTTGSNLAKYFHRHGIEIKRHFRSDMEREVSEYLESLGVRVVNNTNTIIYPHQIDIWLPDYNIGIELNGAYYHSERQGRLQNYHVTKTNIAESKGIKLLQYFDWEFINNREIIFNNIRNLLNMNQPIDGNSLSIKELKSLDLVEFFYENHMNWHRTADRSIVLLDNNEQILSAMSFKILDDGYYELAQFADKNNLAVSNSSNIMFDYFVANYGKSDDKIIGYCDRRWDSDKLLSNLGFKISHVFEPEFFYIRQNGEYAGRPNQFQKHLLKGNFKLFDEGLSVDENMIANNFTKVWDCGRILYSKIV